MSTGATIPMLNPDTGDVHAIPTDQVDAARQAGGKPVATMLDPQGTKRYVPMDQVQAAQKAGGKLVPYGSQSSQEAAQDISGIHPFSNPIAQTAAGIGRALASPVTGAISAVKSAFAPPTNDEELAAQAAAGPGGLLADRAIVQPARQALNTARGFWNQGRPGMAALSTLGALPVIGPAGAALGQRAAAGDIPGAVAEGVTNAFMPQIAKTAAPYAAKLPVVKQVLARPGSASATVPGENYTPAQHQAFSAVLARGQGVGKNFIAPDVASATASAVRQAAADNPTETGVILNGAPKDALGATQAILDKAKQKIDLEHQNALQSVADIPVDMKPVLDALPPDQPFHTETESGQVQALRDQIGKVQTLGQLNSYRQYLGKENAPTFRQTAIQAGRSGPADEALQAADAAAREHYYDQLQKATGQDFQPLKQRESGIMTAQEALQNIQADLVNQDVLAHEDKGLLPAVGNVIDTATRAGHGLPFVGYAAEKLKGTPLKQVQSGMQRFLSDLPAPSTPAPLYGQYVPPKAAQPDPGIWNPNPPVAIARPLELTSGSGAPEYTTPPPSPPGPVNPATARTSVSGQVPAEPVPARGPIIVGPDGTAVRGPAGALPERTGGPLQLGAGTGNPEYVTPPATPPPPVNPETAVTNVNAGAPKPAQEPIPQRTIQVAPNGQASIQRPALPPPETHRFDVAQWQKDNPNGNLKSAIKQARAKGYQIVNAETPPNPQPAGGSSQAAGQAPTAPQAAAAGSAAPVKPVDPDLATKPPAASNPAGYGVFDRDGNLISEPHPSPEMAAKDPKHTRNTYVDKITAPKLQPAKAPTAPVKPVEPHDVASAVDKLDTSGKGNYVTVEKLRKANPGIKDADIFKAAKEGKVVIARYDGPTDGSRDLSPYAYDGHNYYIGVAKPR